MFDADMSSSVYVHNRQKYINNVILGKDSTQVLDDTTLTRERNYATNFSEEQKKFCLSLHYNGANSRLFVNGVKICKFKAKDSENNAAPSSLGNI